MDPSYINNYYQQQEAAARAAMRRITAEFMFWFGDSIREELGEYVIYADEDFADFAFANARAGHAGRTKANVRR